MIEPAMEVITTPGGPHLHQTSPSSVPPGAPPRGPLKPAGLEMAFVTRMSRELNTAVATAARADGLTAGAWVRGLILDRLAIVSAADRRSGRIVHKPAADTVILVAAIRELGAVGHALSCNDVPAAKAALKAAREALMPLVSRGPGQ